MPNNWKYSPSGICLFGIQSDQRMGRASAIRLLQTCQISKKDVLRQRWGLSLWGAGSLDIGGHISLAARACASPRSIDTNGSASA